MTTILGKVGQHERKWWKEATVYQIYPQSFKDGNGDGIGDLPGIISKLDYLKELGVDVVWLSPIYDSPQADMGYDISDYEAIHPKYGSIEDVDRLIAGLHERGMKLMMDSVFNHSSDQHAWFKESRSSRDNPKRDWYVWKDPKFDDKGNRIPPNNWLCVFRGSPAWTWDELTQQYYLRLYTPEQPDLNWENPEVRKAVYSAMDFWLRRGVDGFRLDVINFISKTTTYEDATVTEEGNYLQPAYEHYANGPRIHEYLQEMHREVISRYDTITVGECPYTHDTSVLAQYVHPDRKELQMVFTFEIMDIDGSVASPFIPRDYPLSQLKGLISKYQVDMIESGGWHAVFLENHDHARSVYRYGNPSPEFRDVSAKLLAMMNCTLSGTIYVYQGQELAMGNVPKTWSLEDYPDVATHSFYNEILEQRRAKDPSKEPDMSDIMAGLQKKARDNARTPMQWDDSVNAGFSDGDGSVTPWMKVNEDYKEYNAKKEVNEPSSVFRFWQKALRFRKDNLACIYGVFRQIEPENEELFIYTKKTDDTTLLVVLNFTPKSVAWEIPGSMSKLERLLGNFDDTALQGQKVGLRPYEGAVFSVA